MADIASAGLFEDLVQKKNKTLEEINLFRDLANRDWHIEEYNRLMDQIDGLRVSRSKDPLEMLPRELWEEIVYYTMAHKDLEYWEFEHVWGVNSLLELTCVSRSWQTAIMSTPGFWKKIIVDPDYDDFEAKVALCLHMSQKCPLDLSLYISTAAWEKIGSLISTHSFRIRSLILQPGRRSFPFNPGDLHREVDTVLQGIGDLPSLEALKVTDQDLTGPSMVELLERTTSIRRLYGIRLSTDLLQSGCLQNLRTLTTYNSITNISPLFSMLTSLESIAFYYGPESISHEEVGIFEVASNASLPWRSFQCFPPIRVGLTPLLKSLTIHVEKLHLCIDWKFLSGLFEVAHQMKNLRHLGLTLLSENQEKFDPGPILHSSQIRHLELIRYAPWLFDNQRPGSGDSKNLKLFQALITWAPLVESLILNRPEEPSHAVCYAQTLQHLKRIEFLTSDNAAEELGEMSFSTVEEVFLQSSAAVLALGSYPTALRLTYIPPLSFSAESPCRLEASRWNSLRVLDIHSGEVEWKGVSLPNLKAITLGRSRYHLPMTSPLYEEIANCPTSFPSLNSIADRSCPGWDIVFIMLERRNFYPGNGISPVTTLAFPRLPSQVVLKSLRAYLRGRLPIRPSNYEMSIHAIEEMYFSAQIPGCHICHMGFLHCTDLPIIQLTWFDCVLPPYPKTDDEILRTRHEREAAWSSGGYAKSFRRLTCLRYLNRGLFEITAFTGTGVVIPTFA